MNNSIIVCGEKYDIGTRVILWNEDNGFNAYDTSKNVIIDTDRKTGKQIKTTIQGVRYSKRSWKTPNLEQLKEIVTQFFLHHSGLYRSKDTFNVLHNQRRLSVHFILDDDGTLYQTLDLREKGWHGGSNNTMSVGIEIDSRAHAGRFPDAYDEVHCKKYKVIPRRKRIDLVQKGWTEGYEYNDNQYKTLIRLAIALKYIFPKMGDMNFPTNNKRIIKFSMNNPQTHCGLICHYNNSTAKNDPISFDHYRLLRGIKEKNPNQGPTWLKLDSWEERQEWLKKLGYSPGPIDGEYGLKTKNAIKYFQAKVGLAVDGIWGKKTEYMMDLITKENGLR